MPSKITVNNKEYVSSLCADGVFDLEKLYQHGDGLKWKGKDESGKPIELIFEPVKKLLVKIYKPKNKMEDIKIDYGLCCDEIEYSTIFHEYIIGQDWDEVSISDLIIRFCPCCGAKIEYEEVTDGIK